MEEEFTYFNDEWNDITIKDLNTNKEYTIDNLKGLFEEDFKNSLIYGIDTIYKITTNKDADKHTK